MMHYFLLLGCDLENQKVSNPPGRTSLHQTGDDNSNHDDNDQNNADADDVENDNISNPPGLASIRLEIRSERGEALATIMQIIMPMMMMTIMMTTMMMMMTIMHDCDDDNNN